MSEKKSRRFLAIGLSIVMCFSILLCNQTAFAEETAAEDTVTQQQEVKGEESEAEVLSQDDQIEDDNLQSKESEDITQEKEPEKKAGAEVKGEAESAEKSSQPKKAPAVTRAEQNNVITKIEALMQDGSGPIGNTIGQWQTFRIKAYFELPDDTVKEGDTTTIELPEKLRFNQDLPFQLKDSAGNVIANAVVDGANKKIVLTYTDYPEKNSDVGGDFFFYVRMDRSVVDGETDIPLDFVINNQVISAGSVHFNGYPTPGGSVVAKSGTQESKPNVNGNYAWFDINVNTKGEDLKDVKIVDTLMSEGITIDKKSLKIIKGKWKLEKGDFIFLDQTDVTNQFTAIDWNPDDTGFTISLGDVAPDEGYKIRYYVHSEYELVDGERIDNNVILRANDNSEFESNANITWAVAGGSGAGYVYKIKVKKIDSDNNKVTLGGAEFEVKRVANGAVVGTITTNAEGEAEVSGLLKGDYELREITAPAGYKLLDEPVTISTNDFDSNKLAEVTVENEKNTKSLKVSKNWVGPEANSVTVRLLRSYEDQGSTVHEFAGQTATLNARNNWSYEFTDLAANNAETGAEYKYYIEEEPMTGYESEINEISDGEYSITNTNVETIDIPVTKTWVGTPKEGAYVVLTADRKEIRKEPVGTSDGWKYTFEGLPKYDSTDGHEIQYEVTETGLDNEYQMKRDGDVKSGYTFTNTIQGKTEIAVSKQWIGPGLNSVTVNLYAGEEKKDSVELSSDNNWSYTFTNLEKYDNGKEIEYSVKEEDVTGYESKLSGDAANGYVITNINTDKITIPVEKKWVGKPADSVTIRLLADGEESQTAVLDEKSDWKYTFSSLPKYSSEDGHEIEYKIDEVKVDGYITGISGTSETGFTVTNTITGKVSVPVTKTWDGPKTDKVTVDLLADGVKTDSIELSNDNNWQYTFTDLEKYKDGKEIAYTVMEQKIDKYDTEISGNAQDGYVIKNTNTEKRDIGVKKTWVGDPANSITVRLYADGVEVESVKVTKAMNWQHTFKNLPVYASDGHKIKYSVIEDALDGYKSSISGDADSGFKITNTKDKPPVKEKTPSPNKPGSPKTGDETNITGFMIALILSLAALIALAAFKRRKQDV